MIRFFPAVGISPRSVMDDINRRSGPWRAGPLTLRPAGAEADAPRRPRAPHPPPRPPPGPAAPGAAAPAAGTAHHHHRVHRGLRGLLGGSLSLGPKRLVGDHLVREA